MLVENVGKRYWQLWLQKLKWSGGEDGCDDGGGIFFTRVCLLE